MKVTRCWGLVTCGQIVAAFDGLGREEAERLVPTVTHFPLAWRLAERPHLVPVAVLDDDGAQGVVVVQ